MNKTLLLFTYQFPYGESETFLENEIPVLASTFQKIAICPLEKPTQTHRSLPSNVEVLDTFCLFTKKYKKNLWKNTELIFRLFLFQFISSSRRWVYIKQFRYYLNYLTHKIGIADELYNIITKKGYEKALCYSYWFDYFMLPLSILKSQNKTPYLISRGHGGDVYEYQHNKFDFFFPFRSFQIKNINKICTVSLDGLNHLKQQYPLSKNKLYVSRLGVKNTEVLNNESAELPILVSCSTFFSYKRVHLIPEILKYISIPIKWIHIGDSGDLKHKTINLIPALPKNIEVVLTGQMSNEEVHNFYKKTPVSLFLNVSSSEGLPVSIMEAISFGIPVIATDVGGVREIVNNKTGKLVSVDFKPKEIAEYIEKNISTFSDTEFRKGVKQFWRDNFDAQKNYEDFINKHLLCVE
ncbi:MAG: glycosyltransferase [Bacteroidetes bacterium]|nr:glycosyltransferase [Bacteroidota bacterium]